MTALSRHGVDVATVEEGVAENGMWGIEIEPNAEGAAKVYLAYGDGDEVTLGFGKTHVHLWDSDPEALADEVQEILAAVFAGRFIEAGPKTDAFAIVYTSRGEVSVGAFHLPLPWRFRRTRTYEPYSAPS